jgi:16S rRNA pseudouridine516 synthase
LDEIYPSGHAPNIAGRLDRSTKDLVILTNDSDFSESLTQPDQKIPKTLLVDTDLPITPEAIEIFRAGMFFAKENIHTQPAVASLLSSNSCRLTRSNACSSASASASPSSAVNR